MLRPSFARKVVRLRGARLLNRTLYHTDRARHPPYWGGQPDSAQVQQRAQPIYQAELPQEDVDFFEQEIEEHQTKLRLTKIAEEDVPELDDNALKAFYRSMIESAAAETPEAATMIEGHKTPRMSQKRRQHLLQNLETRLQIADIAPEVSEVVDIAGKAEEGRAERLITALSKLNLPSTSGSSISIKGKEKDVMRPIDLPIGLVSKDEWDALFETFMAKRDARGAEAVLGVMMQHGVQLDEEQYGRVMHLDAYAGRMEEVSRLTTAYLEAGGEMSPVLHNAFIIGLLSSSNTPFRSVTQYLREYEVRGEPLPQESYLAVLNHLLQPSRHHQPSSHSRALAWELFTHMRLHAHPTPGRTIYRSMMIACAEPKDPQPERARDLWIEMTQDGNGIQPTRDDYHAIMRALSSTKRDYLEAFDLFRQMLQKHHDLVLLPFEERPRQLWSAYAPTLETFTALLEGTKRAGDLERARWILSELIGLTGSSIEMGQPTQGRPEEELMSGVFMTYAAWKPRITRRQLLVKTESSTENGAEEGEVDNQLDAPNVEKIAGTTEVSASDVASRSRNNSPRSASDAIREATAIFDRILADVQAKKAGNTDFFQHPFTGVTLRTRLVNSYLSVHLEHASSPAEAYKAWKETWNKVASVDSTIKPNGWSYLMLLERCAAGRRKEESQDDKSMALSWGKQCWKEYIAYVASSPLTARTVIPSDGKSIVQRVLQSSSLDKRQLWLAGLGPRQVERCWKAAIKLYAQTNHTDTALALLKEFRRRYPSEAVEQEYKPYESFGLTTRITDITKLVEPDVPSHLVFADVDVLHQKLVRKEDWAGVGTVKFITKEYEHALFKRKSFRLKNVGVRREYKAYQEQSKLLSKARNVGPSLPAPAVDEDMEGQWDEPFSNRRKAWANRA